MARAEETILLVQDTTSLNYNTHKKMEGIGYIRGKTLGVNIHTCLAITVSGLVLGCWIKGRITGRKQRTKDENIRTSSFARWKKERVTGG